MKNFLFRYLPVLFWMVLIFSFSSQSDLPVSGTYTEDFITKKFAHVLEYVVLMLLMYRASGEKSPSKAFFFSLIFAFTDEIHQLFTPTRTGKLIDVGIDSIGVVIASLLIIKFDLWNSFLSVAPSKKPRK